MSEKKLLILGGTAEAVELAERLQNISGLRVITSLAGRTKTPRKVAGEQRLGGFGGAAGLAEYLTQEQIDFLIDATHPFAAQISAQATAAARQVGVPHIILSRPAWHKRFGDNWIEVADYAAAAAALSGLFDSYATTQRVFLTTGRQNLDAFADIKKTWFLLRTVDPVPTPLPFPGDAITGRGPFSETQEGNLLREQRITCLVSKNSGGAATYAKIAAARGLSLPVVMIQRPPLPEAETVDDVDAAMAWLEQRLA